MSLFSLGMSPFSPMRRQFSSPLVRSSSPLHPPDVDLIKEEGIVQDSKDVLVQRLNDLAAQLSQQEDLREDNVNSLHAKVDEMEKSLSTRSLLPQRRPPRSRPATSTGGERDPFWGSLTPGRVIPRMSNLLMPTQKSASTQTTKESPTESGAEAAGKKRISTAEVGRIAAEAQKLQKELEAVTSSLRARQEETDHIHELLIMRAERAAQRIIHLEKRIKELEIERNEGEMEMLNLQIQLKAIEVQCLSYVPKDADEDLRESISAWKTEWSALKRKRARRKGGSEDSGSPGTQIRQQREYLS